MFRKFNKKYYPVDSAVHLSYDQPQVIVCKNGIDWSLVQAVRVLIAHTNYFNIKISV